MASKPDGSGRPSEPNAEPDDREQVIDFRIRVRWRGPAGTPAAKALIVLLGRISKLPGVEGVFEASKNSWTRISSGG